MTWLDKLQNIDSRVIYWAIFITLMIPLIWPMGVPLSITDTTKVVFDLVEKLQPGDVVLMSLDYTPLVAPEVHSSAIALCKHLFGKDVKVIFYSYIEEGTMFGENIISELTGKYGLVYGTDVVNLGFVSGQAAGVRALGDDVLSTKPRDFRGNVTADLPIMQGVKTAKDFDLVLGIGDGLAVLTQQIGAVHGVTVSGSSTAAGVSGMMPYVNSGQVKGLLQGLRGGAEYEKLTDNPGYAIASMDAQSLGHLAIILFIVIGNVAYFMKRKQMTR